VFPVPARAALPARDYHKAAALNRQSLGRGLSKQAWNIMPKIKAMDDMLQVRPELRSVIKESHPEVCFWSLNNRQAMTSNKKQPRGREERLAVLARHLPQAPQIVDSAADTYRRRDVAWDDILDALVLALSAGHGAGRLRSLPTRVPFDSRGLPMQIVYAQCPKQGQSI
jgi:predicted RNase H-like nuclease